MLSAYQATPIAFMGDGFIIHYECLDETENEAAMEYAEETGIDADYYRYLEEHNNLQALSRYEIGTMESEMAYEMEHYPHGAGTVELAVKLADVDNLDIVLETLGHVEPVSPGWNANLQWDAGVDPTVAIDIIEGMRDALESDIEEMVDALSAVYCDVCTERIE